jgi:hypothetical protein
LFSFNVFCQELDNLIFKGEIILPPGTEEVRIPMSTASFSKKNDAKLYKTNFNKSEILNFYSIRLVNNGWTAEESLAKQLSKRDVPLKKNVAGKEVDLNSLFARMKSFRKDGKVLMVTVGRTSKHDQMTTFTLTFMELPKINQEPTSLPRSVPVYPEAKLLSSSGNSKTYSVYDNINTVFNFYKQRMLSRGWEIVEERPVERRTIGSEVIKVKKAEGVGCKSCDVSTQDSKNIPKEIKEELGQTGELNTLVAKLSFKKYDGKKCKLIFSQMETNTDLPDRTQILIRY